MKIIDLTRTINDGQPGVSFETKYTVAENGWNAKTLHLYSHSGTHMDAPIHFDVSSQTLDQIPLERCLVEALLVDLSPIEPNALITVADIGDVAERLKSGDGLILRTDWSHFFDQAEHYRNGLPRISAELAHWMVEKRVGLLGVEPPSVADVNNLAEVTEIHQILLGGDVIIVEGLINLEQIAPGKFLFAAMPLKIGGGDGAPCRALAIEGLSFV